ncbi:MAG: hypothetical protein ABSA93_38135 [Streptosporangiaceae bacterium]|jgi:hypothetical protein
MRAPGHGNRRFHAVGRVDDADVGSRRAAHGRTDFAADGPASDVGSADVGSARIRLAVGAAGDGTTRIGPADGTAD